MAGFKACELRSGCELTGLSEDEQGTLCEYRDNQGKPRRIRSRFFVGADGKTGFTRKQYLEPKGIFMEKAHQLVEPCATDGFSANGLRIEPFMKRLGLH